MPALRAPRMRAECPEKRLCAINRHHPRQRAARRPSRHPDPRAVGIGQVAARAIAAAIGRCGLCAARRRRPHPPRSPSRPSADAAADGAGGTDRNSGPWHPPLCPSSRWRWREAVVDLDAPDAARLAPTPPPWRSRSRGSDLRGFRSHPTRTRTRSFSAFCSGTWGRLRCCQPETRDRRRPPRKKPVAFLATAMQHDTENARAGLAMGFRMVKMSALSCGARFKKSARRSP